jgi:glycosyltransferase involved in cell wall biosynthesis
VVGTFGGSRWKRLASKRAIPSAEGQGAEVIHHHGEALESYGASLAACRNEGARQASASHLLFLDADDEIRPGFIDAMKARSGDLRTPAVEYVRPNRGPAKPMFWPEKDIRDSNYLIVSTLIPAELFWRVGGFEPFDLYEDWCLFSRCVKAGATVMRVPDAICRVHIDPRSKHRRGSTRREKAEAHEAVRRSVWPELYEELAA